MFESRFQDFEDHGGPAHCAARIAALRAELERRGVQGFLVPRADAHQNEYVPPSEERLAWLTGFTGSAGFAVVLRERAALFVDGRYTVQAREQIDTLVIEPVELARTSPSDWLKENAHGLRIGFDSWLHTAEAIERFRATGIELLALDDNPIDAIWTSRPPAPSAQILGHDERFAGESAASKIARVQSEIEKAGADSLLLTDPHAIAWLFNIRGGDVSHTPLPLAWAVIHAHDRPVLLVEARKLSNLLRDELADLAEISEPENLETELARLGTAGRIVMIDASATAERLHAGLREAGAIIKRATDPIQKMKAVKNAAEIAGTREAHHRDGLAMVRFLAWFDREAPTGKVDEILAAQALETFRRESGQLRDVSFPTISAAGPNAALPHYRVTRASNRRVEDGLFLIDSGAQYRDGTTDITRTIAVGTLSADMKDRYTRVLKGHIAIATARFPKGASGAQLDPLARRALWDAGCDFDHGTGHGVGSYLSVHEGPQRISKLGHTALEPGMILSNEPGYYREGAFGIRIENLELVREDERPSERPMLRFETLTLAPIDTRPILTDLLDTAEIAWLDAYHERVLNELGPLLGAEVREWLEGACAPITRL
ncbi:aminopeptidase P family protein [Terrihabitans sp. B22-R8]|uniref:aminopeptidase P family protein n=1 Tax=Terrihabitans sp. B22-R8 TaxID=3425128 RepID=UPI00403CDFBE